jgi:hypothetical protein
MWFTCKALLIVERKTFRGGHGGAERGRMLRAWCIHVWHWRETGLRLDFAFARN